MIGHITDEKVRLEKLNTESEDILVVEGEIYNERIKIILLYFNCGKLMAGRRYEENRKMQREIERHMIIEDEVNLIILGDMNARLTILEPSIETDANGQMIEEWVGNMDLIHLNRSEKCVGRYTFGKPEGRKSAIDHVIINTKLNENFKGIRIDENGEEINISDHNLVRTWFKIGRINRADWKKPETEFRKWYTLDQEALGKWRKK